MNELTSADYQVWLKNLKIQIQSAQQRAALAVNQELLKLYWQIGNDILQRQQQQGWGSKIIDQLAQDLHQAFPELKGFSARNLKYMRRFAETWQDSEIVQQAAKIATGKPVIIYCHHGIRSQIAIQRLQEKFQFTNLINLIGGTAAWEKQFAV